MTALEHVEFDRYGIGYGCVHGCTDVEIGRACTATRGTVQPTDGHIDLCPAESNCIDAVMHRTTDRDWHTMRGTTAATWFARADVLDSPDHGKA